MISKFPLERERLLYNCGFHFSFFFLHIFLNNSSALSIMIIMHLFFSAKFKAICRPIPIQPPVNIITVSLQIFDFDFLYF